MESPEQNPTVTRSSFFSAEAIIGGGITAGALGVLCALLGWAQWMRLERECSLMWLSIGAVLVVAGGIGAMVGHLRKGRWQGT